jgi:hypothetical protein
MAIMHAYEWANRCCPFARKGSGAHSVNHPKFLIIRYSLFRLSSVGGTISAHINPKGVHF